MILMSILSEKVTLHLILVFPKSIRFIFTPRVRILKLYNFGSLCDIEVQKHAKWSLHTK